QHTRCLSDWSSDVCSSDLDLFDAARPTNTWRLAGGVNFAFPPNITMAAGSYLLLVDFDPVADPTSLSNFRAHYGVSPAVMILGRSEERRVGRGWPSGSAAS